jgi:hypothetical protein
VGTGLVGPVHSDCWSAVPRTMGEVSVFVVGLSPPRPMTVWNAGPLSVIRRYEPVAA